MGGIRVTILLLCLVLIGWGCVDDDNAGDNQTDSGTGTDAATVTDADADTNSDTVADTDRDKDTNTDSDTNANTDANTDSDNDTNSDANTDSDNDTNSDANTDSDNDTNSDANTDSDNDTNSDANTDSNNDTETDTVTLTDADTAADSDTDTERTAPNKPGIINASDGSFTDQIEVTWDPVDGAEEYHVQRSAGDDNGPWIGLGRVSTVIYVDRIDSVDNNVDHDTLYYYRVAASNTIGASDYSTPDSGFLGLSAPTAEVTSLGEPDWEPLMINWQRPPGATECRVLEEQSGDDLVVCEWLDSASDGCADSDFTFGASNNYYVECRDSYANSTSEIVSGTASFPMTGELYVDDPYPSTPYLNVQLNWDDKEGAIGYRIYRRLSTEQYDTPVTTVDATAPGFTSDYEDTGLSWSNNQLYYYSISAMHPKYGEAEKSLTGYAITKDSWDPKDDGPWHPSYPDDPRCDTWGRDFCDDLIYSAAPPWPSSATGHPYTLNKWDPRDYYFTYLHLHKTNQFWDKSIEGKESIGHAKITIYYIDESTPTRTFHWLTESPAGTFTDDTPFAFTPCPDYDHIVDCDWNYSKFQAVVETPFGVRRYGSQVRLVIVD